MSLGIPGDFSDVYTYGIMPYVRLLAYPRVRNAANVRIGVKTRSGLHLPVHLMFQFLRSFVDNMLAT